jgi:hypothetical protein
MEKVALRHLDNLQTVEHLALVETTPEAHADFLLRDGLVLDLLPQLAHVEVLELLA